jgi:hypothetical protein
MPTILAGEEVCRPTAARWVPVADVSHRTRTRLGSLEAARQALERTVDVLRRRFGIRA